MKYKYKPPLKPKVKRIIAIPSTLFLNDPQWLKTVKTGNIARYAAIYRIEDIYIYIDRGEKKNAYFLAYLLRYAETPQYLRKTLFPHHKWLKYAGLIPPLRTPHHPSPEDEFDVEYREGVVIGREGSKIMVDVGLKKPLIVEGNAPLGRRVAVKLGEKPHIVSKNNIPYYWGYNVHVAKSLSRAVSLSKADLKIATSKYGVEITKIYNEFSKRANEASSIFLAFGSKDKGILDMIGADICRKLFDAIINFVPNQGTVTIRTEEAINAVLAIMNVIVR
ncbi:MAG: methylase [Thermoprotei archaeon]|nr:MAG: methylase [Thermoprotei archaeon]